MERLRNREVGMLEHAFNTFPVTHRPPVGQRGSCQHIDELFGADRLIGLVFHIRILRLEVGEPKHPCEPGVNITRADRHPLVRHAHQEWP